MFENHRNLIRAIKELVKRKNYRLTLHAETERDADSISVVKIEEALLHNDVEIIEDYPDDPRGHSSLLVGFLEEGEAIQPCAQSTRKP